MIRRLITVVATIMAAALPLQLLWTFSAAGQEQTITVSRAHDGAHRPSFAQPIFVLVVGNDARSGNPETSRNDSIHIVGIDPVKRRGTIVGIPRDSLVDGRKITEWGYFRSDEEFIDTVERLSGCEFDYYMRVGFEGFAGPRWRTSNEKGGLINALGGVTVRIPSPGLTDQNALERMDPIPSGNQTLNGPQALAWARARYQTSLRPRGDFSRSEAHGGFMIDTLAEMRRDYQDNPLTTIRNIAAVRRHVRLNIPITESLELGLMALQMKPNRVKNLVVDGTIGSHPSAGSIVNITSTGRAQLTDVCADGLLDS